MRKPLKHQALAATIVVVVAAAAVGLVVAAENPANDCLIGVENSDEQQITTDQTCTDGDPTCDADGAADGTCTFHIRGCVNIPGVAGCAARPIKKAKFVTPHSNDKIVLTPASGSTDSACGSFIDFHVPLKHKKKGDKPGKRKIIATGIADVKPAGKNRDKDKINFNCNPSPVGGGTTTTTMLPTNCGCADNPQGGPNCLTLTTSNTGNDLDTGFSGQSHNFINVSNSTLTYCLTGCDGTSTTMCQGSAPTGQGTTNGPTFGPPLPLFSAGVAVCVVNRFQDPMISAVTDIATGGFDATATPLVLLSDTYQGSSNQVCPKCVSNKCDSGRNAGGNCHIDGSVVVNQPPNVNNVTYNVSKDCLPAQANLLGTPRVVLPLTTDTSTLAGNAAGSFPCPGQAKHDSCGAGTCTVDCSAKADPKGGINQTCCSTGVGTPCFPTDPAKAAGQLVRHGSPQALTPALPDPTYPKSGPGVLAATFCISATGSNTVDATAGLPGPGALLLAGQAQYSK